MSSDTSIETRAETRTRKRSRVCRSQASNEGTAETSRDGENVEEIVKTAKKRMKRIETRGSVNRSLDALYKEMRRLKDETRGYREEVNKVRIELQSELQSMVQTEVQTKMKGKFMLPRH